MNHIKLPFYIIIFTLIYLSYSFATDFGNIAGNVKSVESDKGLKNIIVKISELEIITKTNNDGYFQFEKIPTGTYTLVFMAPGYGRTILLNVLISKNQTWYDAIYLQKSAKEEEKFYIGGIEVTTNKELLPEKISTTTIITSGEIEHIQASSLGDILELIPGQEMTNPGLENIKQIGIRQTSTNSAADRDASFGTQILVDGVPLSNNANLQMDTKLNDAVTYRVTTNAGIDLRKVTADNIKSIEVIRGIPSARYGDLTGGAIRVETKSGYTPLRFKYKYNPRNKEANLAGGFEWKDHAINMNLNYAKSLRDIRVNGDFYNRLNAQFNIRSYFLNKNLEWINRFYYTQTFDEQELIEGDINETERYNRSYEGRYNTKLNYHYSDKGLIKFLFSANLNRQNSYIKKIISRDIGIISSRMEEGVEEGYFVNSYISQLWVKGHAWNIYSDLSIQNQFLTQQLLHKWYMGITTRYEFNNGQGREFDPRYPPRSSSNEGDRPRSYEDIPGLTQIALFAEDEITGHFYRDFSLQLGIRINFFGFSGINFNDVNNLFQSDYGTFINPRLNFVYYLSPNNQIRFGYGQTAKSPALSMIYPNPAYFDVVDSVYYDPHNPDNRLAIVNTHIFSKTSQDLKASTRQKFEISYDQKIGLLGMSLTGFYEQTNNGFELGGYTPVALPRYYYPDWPQISPAFPKDTLLLNFRTAINSIESRTKGIELMVATRRIEAISTTFRINAAYHFTDSWWINNHHEYASMQRDDPNLNIKVIPFWNPTSKKSDRLILHYRIDTIIKPLKLWFSLNIQQIALNRNQLTNLQDSLAVGYIDPHGEKIFIPEENRANPEYAAMRRSYDDYLYITETMPNLWLINFKVSKELWTGTEISFFVNNLLNYRPLHQRQRVPSGSVSYTRRNPELFYGIEFSMILNDFIKYTKRFY